jgi:hypothetical protein
VQGGNDKGDFFREPFRFVKHLLYSWAKDVGKGALKQVLIYWHVYSISKKISRLAIFSKRTLVKRRITLNRKCRK